MTTHFRARRPWIYSTLALLLLSYAPAGFAHAFTIAEVDILLTDHGTVELNVPYHIDALMAGVPEGDPTPEQYEQMRTLDPIEYQRQLDQTAEYLRTSVRVKFDGAAIEPSISFPDMITPEGGGNAPPGQRFRLEGAIPEGATEFTFTASPSYNIILMRLREERSGYTREEFVNPGEVCVPYSLTQPAAPQSAWSVIGQYLKLGFTHIVPKGADHILFVLGLYLLSTHLRPLLWQVTAFTVAHTTTLALSSLGIVNLPGSVVEPLIALSIAYVAIENCVTSEMKPWRPAVVFGFGLLHGLGFAGVLRELGLPDDRFVSALLSFNVGVEAGQLVVILAAFTLLGWARKRDWYRVRVAVPGSVGIGVVALYWTVTRIIA